MNYKVNPSQTHCSAALADLLNVFSSISFHLIVSPVSSSGRLWFRLYLLGLVFLFICQRVIDAVIQLGLKSDSNIIITFISTF